MSKRTTVAKWNGSYWRIDVQKDGVRKTFRSSKAGRTGQRECHAKADAWLDDGIDGHLRVEDGFAAYYKQLQQTTGKSNWRPVESRWRIWIQPAIGTRRVETVTVPMMQAVINAAYAKGLSKKSLQNLCGDFTALWGYFKANGYTDVTPTLKIPAAAASAARSVLQPNSLRTLFSVDTTSYRGKPVFDEFVYAYRFQVATGLRPGELMGLRWGDISGELCCIRRSINIYSETTDGKNENAMRSFVLTPLCQQLLQEQKAIAHSSKAADTVFSIPTEKRYYDSWKRYCKSNDIPYIRPYDMRHTFVSVAKTLSEGEIKGLVGHSANMDTFGVYSHFINGDDVRTADRLADVFDSLLGQKTENKLRAALERLLEDYSYQEIADELSGIIAEQTTA